MTESDSEVGCCRNDVNHEWWRSGHESTNRVEKWSIWLTAAGFRAKAVESCRHSSLVYVLRHTLIEALDTFRQAAARLVLGALIQAYTCVGLSWAHEWPVSWNEAMISRTPWLHTTGTVGGQWQILVGHHTSAAKLKTGKH